MKKFILYLAELFCWDLFFRSTSSTIFSINSVSRKSEERSLKTLSINLAPFRLSYSGAIRIILCLQLFGRESLQALIRFLSISDVFFRSFSGIYLQSVYICSLTKNVIHFLLYNGSNLMVSYRILTIQNYNYMSITQN